MNALVNDDYAGPEGVRIIRRPEALEISNYGDLRIPLREAEAGGRSDPRNPTMARMFRLIGRADFTGSGIGSTRSIWQGAGLGIPEYVLSYDPPRVTVRLGIGPRTGA